LCIIWLLLGCHAVPAQSIAWKDRLAEMTSYVLSRTSNSAYSISHSHMFIMQNQNSK